MYYFITVDKFFLTNGKRLREAMLPEHRRLWD